VRQALRILSQPMIGSTIWKLKSAYDVFQFDGNEYALLKAVLENIEKVQVEDSPPIQPARILQSDELHLVCWEYIWP
jgi:hypothetical protein